MTQNNFTDDVLVADDKAVLFGDDSDFYLSYNSGTGNIELTDGTNVLWSIADGGTVGNATVTGTITAGSGANVITTAAGLLAGGKIDAGTVDTTQIADDAIETAKIAAGAVDTTELANDAVDATKLDESGAYTLASLILTAAAGLRMNDDIPIELGTDSDFVLKFNSINGKFEITDGTNTLFQLTINGTAGDIVLPTGGDISAGNVYFTAGEIESLTVAPLGSGALTVDGNSTLGDANTDTITCTGRLIVREVTDAGPMTATNGSTREIVFNTSDSKFYGCTAGGSPATWAALN